MTFPNTHTEKQHDDVLFFRFASSQRQISRYLALAHTNCQGKTLWLEFITEQKFYNFLDFSSLLLVDRNDFHTEFISEKTLNRIDENTDEKRRFSVHIWLGDFFFLAALNWENFLWRLFFFCLLLRFEKQ